MPVTTVGLVAKNRLDAAREPLAELAGWLEARGVRTVFEEDTAALAGLPPGRPTSSKDELPKTCDLIVVLGGDGTLIGMAGRIAEADVDIPILGVNFGSLGFLTEITLPELYPSLESVLAGKAKIDSRLMLRAKTMRGVRVLADRIALNDVAVTKGALSRIIELSVTVDGIAALHVRADGLIVASPTGSTAYNLAAGGSIVHPAVQAMLLTPIAPQILTNRPILVPADAEVRVQPSTHTSHDEMFVTFDGQSGHGLQAGDTIHITRAERPLRLIRSATRSYFDILHEKLKWGGRT